MWTRAFRTNLLGPGCMCPAVVMGTGSAGLADVVVKEVQHFYQMHLDKLVNSGLSPKDAAEFLSTITGALVLANAFADKTMYDRATADFVEATPAKRGVKAVGEARQPAARGARRAAS